MALRWLSTDNAIRFDIEIAADTTSQALSVENFLAVWTPVQAKVAFVAELQAASLAVPPDLNVAQVTAPQVVDMGSVRSARDDNNSASREPSSSASSSAVAGGASAAVCILLVVIVLAVRYRKQNRTQTPPIAEQGTLDLAAIKLGPAGSRVVHKEASAETDSNFSCVAISARSTKPKSCDL